MLSHKSRTRAWGSWTALSIPHMESTKAKHPSFGDGGCDWPTGDREEDLKREIPQRDLVPRQAGCDPQL